MLISYFLFYSEISPSAMIFVLASGVEYYQTEQLDLWYAVRNAWVVFVILEQTQVATSSFVLSLVIAL